LCKLGSDLQREVSSKTSNDCISELTLELNVVHIAKSIPDYSYFSRLNDEQFLSLQSPLESLIENVIHPLLNLRLEFLILLLEPSLCNSSYINILI